MYLPLRTIGGKAGGVFVAEGGSVENIRQRVVDRETGRSEGVFAVRQILFAYRCVLLRASKSVPSWTSECTQIIFNFHTSGP